MSPGSHTRWSPCVNLLINFARKQNELADAQGPAKKSNIRRNKAFTKAFPSLETPIPPLVLSPTENLFTRFIKVFIKMTLAQDQALAKPRERLLKAKTSNIYSRKSHMDCYHFCQQCNDYFKTSGTTGINHILFTATFLCGTISFRWA